MSIKLENLCEGCREIIVYLPRKVAQFGSFHGSRQLVREYDTLSDLEVGASLGCTFCTLLYACHCRSAGSKPGAPCSALKAYRVSRGHSMKHNFIKLECSHAYGWHSEQCLGVMPFIEGRLNQWRASSSASSEESLQLAQGWLSECMRSHPNCRNADTEALPTRLIRIETSTSFMRKAVRLNLIETSVEDRGYYAALSYCWGLSQPTILTSDNIDRMRQKIDLHTLPQTFKDAAVVCIKLGIQYLWIDALCILQDSKRDWHKESAKMGAIYGNSLLTIKASGASDSRDGLFIPRKPTTLVPAKLRCWAPEFEQASQALAYYREVSIEREPLEARAWTLQEDLLSPRVLSYGRKEMWWECNSAMESDGGRQVIETHHVNGLPKPLRTTRPAQFPNHLPGESSIIRANWLFILREYCIRHLTFPEDLLPALSGIARIFQADRHLDRYLAGLWESDIPWNLLWHTADPAPGDGSKLHAPSWSWASVGPLQLGNYVIFDEDVHQPTVCCKFISATIDLVGTNPYGEVRSGSLILEGPLLKVWRVLPADSTSGEQYLYLQKGGYAADLHRDIKEKFLSDQRLGTLRNMNWAYDYNRQGQFKVDRRLLQNIGDPIETWLLFIVGVHDAVPRGIVLDPITLSSYGRSQQLASDGTPSVFRRIGSFWGGTWPYPNAQRVTIE